MSQKLLDIIKQRRATWESFNRVAPIIYIADITLDKYMYFYGSSKQMLGYDMDFLADAGPNYYINLLHQNDSRIYQEKVFPEVTAFLKRHNQPDYSDYLFSCNYRIKKNDGEYVNMLQRVTYFSLKEFSIPLVEMGSLTDINNYKDDTRMIHVIEKTGYDINAYSTVQLFKSVYFPDRLGKGLSNREREILKGISEGLSSKEIANKLFISINTIHNHRKNMLQKTHTNNSAELLKYALSNYLL